MPARTLHPPLDALHPAIPRHVPRGFARAAAAAFAALAAGLGLASAIAPNRAHAQEAFDEVYASRARLVCRIPRSGNKQKVLGFDGGFSFVYGRAAYWSLGDSWIDGNGDGLPHPPDEPLGFRAGSIGRTGDLRADDCVTVKLRTTTGRDALPVLIPDVAHGECTIWPNGVFEADSKLYFFYGVLFRLPDCGPNRPVTYGIGLGQLTSPSTKELGPVRVGGDAAWKYYLSPLKIADRIYVFHIGTGGQLFVARVDERFVTSRDSYEYWNGATWGDSESSAVPIAVVQSFGGPTIAYNAYVGRHMMIYACDAMTKMCARTARIPGSSPAALVGGWNDETEILGCGLCAHTHWHTGYTDPRYPQRIYVSTGRFPGRAQFLSLWEIDLAAQPAPATRSFHYAASDLFGAGAGAPPWSYASYDLAQTGAGLVALVTPGPSPPDRAGSSYPGYVGAETAGGVTAPGGFSNGAWPSPTKGGAIVWTAPGNGTVEISGSMWLESTLGDGAVGDVLLVRGSSVLTLWSKHLAARWKPVRQRNMRRQNVQVLAGDQIVFGVRAGKRPTNTALHDMAYIDPTVTFDAG
ncbi:MAG: hypothetical protein AB1689_02750 [Thermodesulfobacteriota bacterium]